MRGTGGQGASMFGHDGVATSSPHAGGDLDRALSALPDEMDLSRLETGFLGSDDEWRQLIETLPQIVWVTRPDGWHIHFNQQWMDFTGLTLEESLGHGWNPPFHPEDRPRARALWQQATSTGEPYEIEYRLRRFDGVYHWMLGRTMPLRDASGAIVKWFGTCTDIEELKQAQAALEQSRSLHRLAGSMAKLGGWSLDVADEHMVWSEEIYEIIEAPDDAEPGLEGSIGLYLPAYQPRLRAAVEACATSGSPFDLELALETYRGRRLWVRVIGEAHAGPDGEVAQVTGALQDITAFKETSHRNQVLAERLTTTLESITDAFYTLDREWRFTYMNGHATELLQRDREELLGRTFWDEFAPALGTELEVVYRRAMAEGATFVLEAYHYHPLGTWFQVTVYPSEQGLAVYFRDVSTQHRDRRALQERVKELRALAAISGGAHGSTDPRELCDLTANSLVAAMRRPDQVSAEVVLGEVGCRAGRIHSSGTRVAVPILIEDEEHGSVVVGDVSGDAFLPEERSLVRSVAESLGLWLGRHRADVALQQVNEELQAANAQLEEAAQLKDDLLSMASHELRTPLTPILGFLEILATHGENLSNEQQQMVQSMGSNARRMLRLVDDLLVVSRAAADVLVSRPEPVDAQQVLGPVLEELGDRLPDVELSVEGCRPYVDPQHLQQIVLNLLTNTSKYGAAPFAVTAVPGRDGCVVLEVADRGPGVPPAFQERLWGRFVQKDRGDTRTATGAGLGLSIVRLLTEANGGTVGYRDASPTGAVFTVALPGTSV
ncbi:MAG: PAS domain-containing protein [Nitriliruptoraceae bacterium]